MKRFIAFTDSITECECCGKTGLKGTYCLENKHLTANDAKPVLAVVPKCSHFWKMVTKNYYKCGWCDERHYC